MDNKVGSSTNITELKYDLAIASLNVRGINDHVKRKAIFKWLLDKKFDVVFLQECYSCDKDEPFWLNDWGGKGIFSHGTKHSKGTVILFRQGFDIQIKEHKEDSEGRYIIAKVIIEEESFVLINLYAPNRMAEKEIFFVELKKEIESVPDIEENHIIMAGDWNSIQDVTLDKKGGAIKAHETVTDSMKTLLNSFDLIDIWRILHPLKTRFTFRQKTPLIQSQLDYFMISNEMQDYIHQSEVIPSIWSDHSCVTLYIKLLPENVRGNGYWKLNTTVLENQKYVNDMNENIIKWVNEFQNMTDKRIVWELLKYNIRKYTMSFCSQTKLDKNREEKLLRNELNELEIDLSRYHKDETLLAYNRVKEQLKEIESEKIQGAIIRSKAKFIEEGERSTKYFYDLEKHNVSKKQMRKMKLQSGETTTDFRKILESQKDFYSKLYTSHNTGDADYGRFLENSSLPCITQIEKDLCDVDLSLDELKAALKTFERNKSPGNDGIVSEFYIKFWEAIGKPMLDCFEYSFRNGELSNSQKQAVITLLEKPGKDRQQIKNWRPISLLNHDYKILTKALSLRIRKVLPSIINSNQSGYVDGRYIGDSIRLIQDVMEYSKLQKLSGMLLFIDFQKAFDSVEFDFIAKTLSRFNFGKNLIKWLKVLYKNATSCIINNGITSPYFKISRGVRQGDPLSPYIFILVIEVLANYIRNDKQINGIKIKQKELKISLYADDITIFASDKPSAKRVFKVLSDFSECSGLRVNKDKTEGMWIGQNIGSQETPFNIAWPKAPIKVLGIYLSYDVKASIQANFDDKIARLVRQLHWWKSRNLSLTGRVLIVKTLGLPRFTLLASLIHIPINIVNQINSIIYEFIWKGKTDKVNRKIFAQDYKLGGHKMIDFGIFVKSAKCKWIQRYLDNELKDWKSTFELFCKKKNLQLFLQSNFSRDEIPTLIPNYYKDILNSWFEIIAINNDYQDKQGNQLIWYNKLCMVGNKTSYNERLFQAGIWTAQDLFENGKVIPFDKWLNRGVLKKDYLPWRNIIASIPNTMKQLALLSTTKEIILTGVCIKGKHIPARHICEKDIKTFLVKSLYDALKPNDFKVKNKLSNIFGNLEDWQWENIYSLPRESVKDNRIKEFQYKILFRYIGTNRLLYKIGKLPSPSCSFCFMFEETIEHIFYQCNYVKNFWFSIFDIWNRAHDMQIDVNVKDIILGYDLDHAPFNNISKAVNLIILYGKSFIFKCKVDGHNINLRFFQQYLKCAMEICKYEESILLNVTCLYPEE